MSSRLAFSFVVRALAYVPRLASSLKQSTHFLTMVAPIDPMAPSTWAAPTAAITAAERVASYPRTVLENLSAYAAQLDDPAQRLEGATHLRKLLSIERNPPIQAVCDAPGALLALCRFLQDDAEPALQFEAAWALTNVASGASEYTQVVANLGAVPAFVRLLHSLHADVKEQAVRAVRLCRALFESGVAHVLARAGRLARSTNTRSQ
jgi:hypothetical protein